MEYSIVERFWTLIFQVCFRFDPTHPLILYLSPSPSMDRFCILRNGFLLPLHSLQDNNQTPCRSDHHTEATSILPWSWIAFKVILVVFPEITHVDKVFFWTWALLFPFHGKHWAFTTNGTLQDDSLKCFGQAVRLQSVWTIVLLPTLLPALFRAWPNYRLRETCRFHEGKSNYNASV